MKRIAFLLACLMMCLSICSCAIEPIADASLNPKETTAPTTQSTQPAEPDEPEQSAVSPDGEYLLYDSNDIAIKVTSIKPGNHKGEWDFGMKYVNNSDKTLEFCCDYLIVNGWEPYDSWYSTLEPGETVFETLEIDKYNMPDQIISSADKVTFCFEVTDSEDWLAEPVLSDTFTIYPTGLTDSQIVVPERNETKGEYVIADNEDVAFVVMEINEDAYIGAEILCYLENKTDKPIEFSWNNAQVNNWAVNSFFSRYVSPCSRTYSSIYMDQNCLDLCGIRQIDKLDFELVISSGYADFDIEPHYYVRDYFRIMPTGMSPEDIPLPERTPVAGEIVILDNEDFTVILDPLHFKDDSVYMNLFVRNDTDADIYVSAEDFTLNGSDEVFNYAFEPVPAGGHLYYPIVFMDYLLDSLSADELESIHCKFEIIERETFDCIFSEDVSSSFLRMTH